jgi:hypothetical protein
MFEISSYEYNFLSDPAIAPSSDVEAEAEAPEVVVLWWKRKRLKICRFRFLSVSKLVYKFWQIFAS